MLADPASASTPTRQRPSGSPGGPGGAAPAGWAPPWRCHRSGWARSLESGEELDDIGCLEDPIALPPDVSLTKNPSSFETLDGFPGAHLGSSDQLCGTLDGDGWDPREDIEEQFDRRIGADASELLAYRPSSASILLA
ncbi:MAG: hypothetical protein R2715_14455 [Ilumatobacteraceae bacterium]